MVHKILDPGFIWRALRKLGTNTRKLFLNQISQHIYLVSQHDTLGSNYYKNIHSSIRHLFFTDTGSPFSILIGFFKSTDGDGEGAEGGGVGGGGTDETMN